MTRQSISPREVIKVISTQSNRFNDSLAVEEPLEIRLSALALTPPVIDQNISITMRTPGADGDLAAGFLFTEGIIDSGDQILDTVVTENIVNVILQNTDRLDLDALHRNFYTTSSCGVCGKSSIDAVKVSRKREYPPADIIVYTDTLMAMPGTLRMRQQDFERTGGLHAAALFSPEGELLLMREDVGRHNALDKLIGSALLQGSIPLREHVLLLSGRASFELLQKAAMAGIQIVCAVGAPSSLAVDTAEEFDITLVGFLTHQSFNVYSGALRVRYR